MPRILHVIASMAAASGGPTTAMWNTLEALRRQGVDAELATTNTEDARQSLSIPRDLDRTRIHLFPRQTGFYTASMPLLRWLWSHVANFDVVHVHGLFSFAPVAAAWCARQRRVPYIIRPAGVLNRWGRTERRPLAKRLSLAAIEGGLLCDAARVHFTTPFEMREAAELRLPLRSALVPLGIDIDTLPLDADEAASFDLAKEIGDRPVVLFLSRIDPIKRVDLLLDAFAAVRRRIPRALLLIAGDGPRDLLDELTERCRRLELNEHVRWLGFVEGGRKRALLRRADLFVLPSFSENFGIALIEAMAAGKPVIASDGVGIAWLAAQSGGGIVFDGTERELGDALERLLANADLRTTMGRAAQLAVRQELSLEALGIKLRDLYGEIATAR